MLTECDLYKIHYIFTLVHDVWAQMGLDLWALSALN